jgi:hypothetical protein
MVLLRTIPSFLFSHTVCPFLSTVPVYVTALDGCTYSPLPPRAWAAPLPPLLILRSLCFSFFLLLLIFFLFLLFYLFINFSSLLFHIYVVPCLSHTWYWLHFPRLLYLRVSRSHYTSPLPSHHPHTESTLLTGIMFTETNHPTPFSI